MSKYEEWKKRKEMKEIRSDIEMKGLEQSLIGYLKYKELERKIKLLTDLDVDDFIKELAKKGLGNTDIEPQKTLQVIVKNYDSTVYTTELPEDEAMKLIEGWKGNDLWSRS